MSGFRGALIGCGFFARNHMHGWADAQGAEIVAVCDVDRSKAEAFARDFGVAEVFTDAEAMLTAVKPDFVDVATTVESHRPLVELALANGALTICQKPFAETWADAVAMVKAAERAGRPLIVHENFRWERAFRIVRAEIDAGAIGAPHFARLSFRHGYDVYANQPYLARVEDFALMDVGLHLFDVARFLMGDVASVACMTQRLNPIVTGEDAFTALLRHTSGGVSSVECSFFSKIAPDPFPETFAWIEGPDGTIEVTYGCRVRVHRDGAVREIDGDPPVPSWGAKPWHMVQDSVAAFEAHVVDVLRGDAEPQPSGRHNLGTLAVTFAAYRSAARGEVVDMERFVAAGCAR
jgi:predicted dehydrogenase